MTLSGLSFMVWLIIAWGTFTAILLLLLIYRGMIGMHQEEQIFLSDTARAFEAESAGAAARAARLRPYIRASGLLAGLFTLAVAALWIAQTLQQFKG